MPDIQRYLNGIEAQHQSAPRYMATVTALLEKLDDARTVLKAIPGAFSLESAAGRQLDILGETIGIDRRITMGEIPGSEELLDDEAFRQVIQAKIIRNQWNGGGQSFQDIWNSAFRQVVTASWYDNQDMSVDLSIEGNISEALGQLIQRGYYIPRPAGVAMNVIIVDRNNAGTAAAWAMARVAAIETRGLEAVALGGGILEIVYDEDEEEEAEISSPVAYGGLFGGGN